MGVWDLYCVICGAICEGLHMPPTLFGDNLDKKNMSKYFWLSKIFILMKDDDLVISGEVNTGNVTLESKKYPEVQVLKEYADDIDIPFGVPCHKACHQLLKKYLKYNLKFSDINKRILYDGSINLKWGIMERYQEQFFEYETLLDDNNEWLIESPLKNTKNRERILKLWRPIISKLPSRSRSRPRPRSRSRSRSSNRKSPAESATCFKIGTRKRGLDGNMWQIRKSGKSQRWMRWN